MLPQVIRQIAGCVKTRIVVLLIPSLRPTDALLNQGSSVVPRVIDRIRSKPFARLSFAWLNKRELPETVKRMVAARP